MCNHGLGKTVFWMQFSEAHLQVPAHFPLPEVWEIFNNLSAYDYASHAKCYECLQQQAQILSNTLFINENKFTHDGINNTRNFCSLVQQNPQRCIIRSFQ
jgi:hypothetical protein